MRVLLVHEYYRERGGEDAAFEADCDLLESAGVDVHRWTVNNVAIPDHGSLVDRLRLFAETTWSERSRRAIALAIAEARPDVVHFHNTFPLISPAAFTAARGVGVLATLHNYRLVCPGATFYRSGALCEDCLRAPLPFPGVLHRCYRSSAAQSAAVAAMLVFHRLRKTWLKDVDTLIAPSRFLRSKLIEGGVPAEKINVRPNAVVAPTVGRHGPGEALLYVGRLTPNKGIETMLRAWRENAGLPPLQIAGAGELASSVEKAAAASRSPIVYLGSLPREGVFRAMSEARALLFPSLWYENQPVAILEAFACGLPVLASNLGALPELVQEGRTGRLLRPGDASDLTAKVRWAVDHPDELARLGEQARETFESEYSPQRSIENLLELYRKAQDRSKPLVGRRELAVARGRAARR